MINRNGYQITRHICPRNCYDACGMLAYARNGMLEKVTGDPDHGYTQGKLCTKGQAYLQRVYSPERLRYPMRQIGRGSGRWERLTWQQAMTIICEKILAIRNRYQSLLPFCLNKYSGNFGILHSAVEGMFNSLGPTSQTQGSPCWSAGLDAQIYDLGKNITSDPQDMIRAKVIILWGVNPAWTSIHSMAYLYQAKIAGAKVIVIDPIYTQTARKSDYYVQVKPGEDGALALALAKLLLERGYLDQSFIDSYTLGWSEFKHYLENIDFHYLAEQCGQDPAVIEKLATLIGINKPLYIWAGFGLQRHVNGGNNLRLIDALAAMTGNFGLTGGGVQYAHQLTWGFHPCFPESPAGTRYLNINDFSQELDRCTDPPIQFLWISCRNLVTQDVNGNDLLQKLAKIDFIVTVEQFLTPTASYSDIVLPTTTQFEELDVVPSYWHYWIGLNEPAIAPLYAAKSDLEIAQLLAKTLNRYSSGTSTFPVNKTPAAFLDDAFQPAMNQLLGINHWSELTAGPRRAILPYTAWGDKKFATESGKFEFFSERAKRNQLSPIAQYRTGKKLDQRYPYWLITSHSQHGLNSQFQNLHFLLKPHEPLLFIHPKTAALKNVKTGVMLRVYNDLASIVVKARVSTDVAPDILLCYQGWIPGADVGVNRLNKGITADMGNASTGLKGIALYDVLVDFEPL